MKHTVNLRVNPSLDSRPSQRSADGARVGRAVLPMITILSLIIVSLHAKAQSRLMSKPEGPERRTELVYEGMVSYGNYRVFGAAESAKLYTSGVELDRELWPNLFRTRVDGVVEILPFILLTQPAKTDVWGDPLTRRRKTVPGAGVTPLGFRLLWRDDKRIMPYFEAKGSVFAFTQKALSSQATYENWSFHLTQGVKVKLHGRYDLRLGMLSDLHFSNGNIVRSNPALDVMNLDLGLVCHLSQPKSRVIPTK